jgi:hypothetical protein
MKAIDTLRDEYTNEIGDVAAETGEFPTLEEWLVARLDALEAELADVRLTLITREDEIAELKRLRDNLRAAARVARKVLAHTIPYIHELSTRQNLQSALSTLRAATSPLAIWTGWRRGSRVSTPKTTTRAIAGAW